MPPAAPSTHPIAVAMPPALSHLSTSQPTKPHTAMPEMRYPTAAQPSLAPLAPDCLGVWLPAMTHGPYQPVVSTRASTPACSSRGGGSKGRGPSTDGRQRYYVKRWANVSYTTD